MPKWTATTCRWLPAGREIESHSGTLSGGTDWHNAMVESPGRRAEGHRRGAAEASAIKSSYLNSGRPYRTLPLGQHRHPLQEAGERKLLSEPTSPILAGYSLSLVCPARGLSSLWHVTEPPVWQAMVGCQCGSGVQAASRRPLPRLRAQALEAPHSVGEEIATRREGVARTTPAVQPAPIE